MAYCKKPIWSCAWQSKILHKKKFCPQNWENGHKIRQKLSFLNLLKNLINFINFYWISSVMKIYVICCAPAQIPYLGRFLFLRYRPICFQPTRLQDFLINHISRKNQSNSLFFLHVITNPHKCWSKHFWVGIVKTFYGQSSHGTLKVTE